MTGDAGSQGLEEPSTVQDLESDDVSAGDADITTAVEAMTGLGSLVSGNDPRTTVSGAPRSEESLEDDDEVDSDESDLQRDEPAYKGTGREHQESSSQPPTTEEADDELAQLRALGLPVEFCSKNPCIPPTLHKRKKTRSSKTGTGRSKPAKPKEVGRADRCATGVEDPRKWEEADADNELPSWHQSDQEAEHAQWGCAGCHAAPEWLEYWFSWQDHVLWEWQATRVDVSATSGTCTSQLERHEGPEAAEPPARTSALSADSTTHEDATLAEPAISAPVTWDVFYQAQYASYFAYYWRGMGLGYDLHSGPKEGYCAPSPPEGAVIHSCGYHDLSVRDMTARSGPSGADATTLAGEENVTPSQEARAPLHSDHVPTGARSLLRQYERLSIRAVMPPQTPGIRLSGQPAFAGVRVTFLDGEEEDAPQVLRIDLEVPSRDSGAGFAPAATRDIGSSEATPAIAGGPHGLVEDEDAQATEPPAARAILPANVGDKYWAQR